MKLTCYQTHNILAFPIHRDAAKGCLSLPLGPCSCSSAVQSSFKTKTASSCHPKQSFQIFNLFQAREMDLDSSKSRLIVELKCFVIPVEKSFASNYALWFLAHFWQKRPNRATRTRKATCTDILRVWKDLFVLHLYNLTVSCTIALSTPGVEKDSHIAGVLS